MKFPNRSLVTVVLVLCVTLLASGSLWSADLVILHTNDVHGRLDSHTPRGADAEQGGLVRVATLVEEQRAIHGDKVILLDAGDTIHGTNIVNLFGGQPAIEVMNAMGYNAMTLGNHEFNFGQETLLARVEDANFPVLGANVFYEDDGSVFTVSAYIEEFNGIRVAVLGLVAQDTPVVTHPANVEGLRFADPVEVGAYLARRLKIHQDADVVIALTHVGYGVDEALAWAAPDIDIIVGGHSHTTLEEPANINGTIVVQANEYGNYLGALAIDVELRTVMDYDYQLIPVGADIPKHPEIAAIIDEWHEVMTARLGETVARTGMDWNGEREYVRTQETNLGNLVTDIMRAATDADIAITNGGGIRASINRGEITVEDIYTVLPFDNTLVVLELTGFQILEALEHSVRLYPEQNGGFLQVSGMSFDIDPDAAPGSRINRLRIHGFAPDLSGTYRVATNDFMAAGGDGYAILADAPVHADTGIMLRDVVVEYAQEQGVLTMPEAGRIGVMQ